MNTNEIAFIICVSDVNYYNECVKYIEDLIVPEGYCVDVIAVEEAESMTMGYNAGMQASDAKYKVYLHQDTYILNRNFIYDILRIFQKNEMIGMIGVIGSRSLPANANCYLAWNIGKIMAYDGSSLIDGDFAQNPACEYIQVEAVDGLIMITQHDILWREDILDGWDFYDVSQSLEMRRLGYQVVVPYQENAWCYHDCGVSNLKDYDFYRQKMIAEYEEIFDATADFCPNIYDDLSDLRNQLIQLVDKKMYQQLEVIAGNVVGELPKDTQIREIFNVTEIYSNNKTSYVVEGGGRTWREIGERYCWIRNVLRRIEFLREDKRIEELKVKINSGEISMEEIKKVAEFSLESSEHIDAKLGNGENKPLVSVIMPTYNAQDFVAATVESVLNQTYRNIEFIIIDDASTDGTVEVLEAFSDQRMRKVYLKENKNVCNAGNVALKMAKGKYVANIGHDDIWNQDKLEKQVTYMEKEKDCAVCFSHCDLINEQLENVNEKYESLYKVFQTKQEKQETYIKRMIFDGNMFCAPTAVIRKKVLDEVGFYKYGLLQLQDYELWLRIMVKFPIYVFPEKLVKYRRFDQIGKNISSESDVNILRTYHEMMYVQEQFILSLDCEMFYRIFDDVTVREEDREESGLLCEKFFLLCRLGNPGAAKLGIHLLENEVHSEFLKKYYGYQLKDFYEIMAKPYSGESAYYDKAFKQVSILYAQALNEQSRIVEEQQRMLEQQEQVIKMQQEIIEKYEQQG